LCLRFTFLLITRAFMAAALIASSDELRDSIRLGLQGCMSISARACLVDLVV